MSYADVYDMLRRARPGDSVEDWRTAALDGSRLLSGDRRTTQLRIASAILRPIGDRIVDEAFLRDLVAADDGTARDLVYGRYLASVEIAIAFARQYLQTNDNSTRGRPIGRGAIDASLAEMLPTCSAGTRARTRTAIGTQFAAAGIVHVDRRGNLRTTGKRPAPLAVFHVINEEIRGRREASDAWLASHSLATAIFAIAPVAFQSILDELISSGRLLRSYYLGEPRVLAA